MKGFNRDAPITARRRTRNAPGFTPRVTLEKAPSTTSKNMNAPSRAVSKSAKECMFTQSSCTGTNYHHIVKFLHFKKELNITRQSENNTYEKRYVLTKKNADMPVRETERTRKNSPLLKPLPGKCR